MQILRSWLLVLLVCTAPTLLMAQAPNASTKPAVPEWAYPGSATRTQVAPPPDFRRASTHFNTPIGIFEGQSDIGSALVPGNASYDDSTKQYTINSAGYNIWYYRDEFRYLWKKMSGDVSLAADIAYPDPTGYGDRKAVLVIRQDIGPVNTHFMSCDKLLRSRARRDDRRVLNVHKWRSNDVLDRNSSSHLKDIYTLHGLRLESSAASLQNLLISTYELRFAPSIRRLEAQRST